MIFWWSCCTISYPPPMLTALFFPLVSHSRHVLGVAGSCYWIPFSLSSSVCICLSPIFLSQYKMLHTQPLSYPFPIFWVLEILVLQVVKDFPGSQKFHDCCDVTPIFCFYVTRESDQICILHKWVIFPVILTWNHISTFRVNTLSWTEFL